MRNIHKMKKIAALLLAAALTCTAMPQTATVAYAAATDNVAAVRANSPKLSDSKVKLKVGEKYKLTYSGMTGTVKWKSSNKSVATVNSKGLVKVKNPGKATITVTGAKATLKCTVRVRLTQKQVQDQLFELYDEYPEGMSWTNENHSYYWKAINTYCYGCIAFAGEMSDRLFGKDAKVTTHRNFDKIKVGDHIRIGDYHSVIVLAKGPDELMVVEGNYNSSVHWGREITKSELKSSGFYVQSRY